MDAVEYNCLCCNVLLFCSHRTGFSGGNAVKTYSGDVWLESLPGQFLYWLNIISGFLNLSRQIPGEKLHEARTASFRVLSGSLTLESSDYPTQHGVLLSGIKVTAKKYCSTCMVWPTGHVFGYLSINKCHVTWVPCHHGMARPQVADGGDSLQFWRVAVNILN
jgi:hypothetical protein